ncbi:MAG: glycine/betaine/sarcosine/D-proline family reductase selenoprotein B [Chloroflexi bacterium]|nr:glycine/betaine/sarcosine/D-proline family reductase selenoprotein B [Chloroflexota bacterium]
MAKVRLMHFMNQFFAGEGGEESADLTLASKEGPVGPGRRLQALLGDTAEIVVTAYCGDNYFASQMQDVLASVVKTARDRDVGMVVAGPSFMAGRYGFACVEVCHAVSASLALPCVTAMHPENSAVAGYTTYQDKLVYALPATEHASGMEDALSRTARLVAKLSTGVAIGPAAEEGYIARGIRLPEFVGRTGAERAIDMLLSKSASQPFESEVPIESIDAIPVTPRVAGLKDAHIALATTSGIVPVGNPDGFKGNRCTTWHKYPLDDMESMQDHPWEVMHGGYNTRFMTENPNYGIPLDVCRQLLREGAFGKLHPFFYSTTGSGAFFSVMQANGLGMVQDLKAQSVDAVIMVST